MIQYNDKSNEQVIEACADRFIHSSSQLSFRLSDEQGELLTSRMMPPVKFSFYFLGACLIAKIPLMPLNTFQKFR